MFTLWRKIELIFASSWCLVGCLSSFEVFFCRITWVPFFLEWMQSIHVPMYKTLASILDVCIEGIHGKWIKQVKIGWNTTTLSRDFAQNSCINLNYQITRKTFQNNNTELYLIKTIKVCCLIGVSYLYKHHKQIHYLFFGISQKNKIRLQITIFTVHYYIIFSTRKQDVISVKQNIFTKYGWCWCYAVEEKTITSFICPKKIGKKGCNIYDAV